MAISPNPGGSGAGAAAASAPPGGPVANHSRRQMPLSRPSRMSERPRGLWRAMAVSMSLRGEMSRRHHWRNKSSIIPSTAHRNSLRTSNDEFLLPPPFDDKVRSSGPSGGGPWMEGHTRPGHIFPNPTSRVGTVNTRLSVSQLVMGAPYLKRNSNPCSP